MNVCMNAVPTAPPILPGKVLVALNAPAKCMCIDGTGMSDEDGGQTSLDWKRVQARKAF